MNRRERERKKQRLVDARESMRRAERETRRKEALPSRYGIRDLSKLQNESKDRWSLRVVIYCRVSDPHQDLAAQRKGIRWHLAKLGVRVLCSYSETTNGKCLLPSDRPKLFKAIAAARKLGVPLVVVCVSRLVRNAEYHIYRNPEARPTKAEFKAFMAIAKGVTICTLNNPDSSPPEDEALLNRLAADAKGKRVGRPLKKRPGWAAKRRKQYLSQAREMRKQDKSYRRIAAEISKQSGHPISHAGVRKWIKASSNGRV
jgi:DNA invertase Pin-like site-specific DNA recombinase